MELGAFVLLLIVFGGGYLALRSWGDKREAKADVIMETGNVGRAVGITAGTILAMLLFTCAAMVAFAYMVNGGPP